MGCQGKGHLSRVGPECYRSPSIPLRLARWQQQRSEREHLKRGETEVLDQLPCYPLFSTLTLEVWSLSSREVAFLTSHGLASRVGGQPHPSMACAESPKKGDFQEWHVDLPMPAPSNAYNSRNQTDLRSHSGPSSYQRLDHE